MTIVVGGEALVDLVPHAGGRAARARRRRAVQHRAHARAARAGRALPRLPVRRRVRRAAAGAAASRTASGSTRWSTRRCRRRSRWPSSTSAARRPTASTPRAPARRRWSPRRRWRALPETVDFLHVGTLGLVMEPTAMALQAVVEAVAERALIMVDPNCRPTFIPDRDDLPAQPGGDAALRPRRQGLQRRPRVPRARRGPDRAPRATCSRDGPQVALVTLGGDGALIVTAEPARRSSPRRRSTVVDTIGAGDAFGGGFLAYWRMKGLDRDALGDADAVRAATTLRLRRRRPHVRAGRARSRRGCQTSTATSEPGRARARRRHPQHGRAITMPTTTAAGGELERRGGSRR